MSGFWVGRRFSLTLILLAAALAWWLSQEPEDRMFIPQPKPAHEPDYFLDGFETTVAGEDGHFRYRLNGATLTHYPDTDTALLEQPRLLVNTADGGRWLVSATEATAQQQTGHIHLEGQVIVHRDSRARPADSLTLETEALDVYVDDDYADTDADVTITRPTGVTRARGMRVNFPQRHLYLKSQVRGEYVPVD
jgi:lipopolysaccharide export system protein LptC